MTSGDRTRLADLRLLGGLLLAALLALAFLHWAFVPRRYVPRFRVATLRARLLLRLHPGRGFMTLPGLWLHWSRSAALRGSGRVRPGLPLLVPGRPIRPRTRCCWAGRSTGTGCGRPIQENILIIGRSRSGKSGWLAKVAHPLPRRRGQRDHQAGPVHADQRPAGPPWPAGLHVQPAGPRRRPPLPPTIRYDPVPGCQDESVAMRRGTALTDAVRVKGTEDDGFWNEQAATQMPALLCAAALDGLDLREVARWVLSERHPRRRADPARGTGATTGRRAWRRCAARPTRPPRRSAWC